VDLVGGNFSNTEHIEGKRILYSPSIVGSGALTESVVLATANLQWSSADVGHLRKTD
jgi:hypothetical protein